MTFSEQKLEPANIGFSDQREILSSLSTTRSPMGARVWRKMKAVLFAVQVARMKSVLSQLSDEQLAQIGCSRSEISKYAKALMSNE